MMRSYLLCLLTSILLLNSPPANCKFQDINNETLTDNNDTTTEILLTKKYDKVLLSGITQVTKDSSKSESDYRWLQLTTENFQGKLNGTFNLSTKRPDFQVISNTNEDQETGLSNQIHTTISKQHYPTSSLPEVLQDKCFSYGSCEFSFSDPTWFCRCDSLCNEFKDCCLGFNSSRADRKTSYNFQCFAMGSEITTYTKGILAVDDCPATYKNTSVIERCYKDDVVTQGTFVAYKADLIFKNKFCALCNNITDFIMFEIQLYKVFLDAEELKNVSRLTEQEKLAIIFARSQYKVILPNNIRPRYCLLNVVKSNDSFCQLYVNPVASYTRIKVATFYRNYFCVPKENRNSTSCLAQIYMNIRSSNIFGLSVIFSFQFAIHKSATSEDEQCKTWIENMNNKCQYLETYMDYSVKMMFYLISNRNITESDWLLVALLSVWNFEIQNFTSVKSFELMVEKQGFIARVTLVIFITKRTFFHEALRIEKEIKDANLVLYVRDNSTDFETIVSKTNDVSENTSFPYYSYEKLVLKELTLNDILPGFNVFVGNQIALDFCSDVKTGLTQKMQTVYLDHRTCLAIRPISDSVVSISAILTYACFSVSDVALIIMIIINRKYKSMTSIAMTNLENMSMSLLLCNILFMAGIWATHIEKICYMIGVFLHYLWLTFFSFMTIAVYNIVTTLTKMKLRNSNASYYERRRRHCLTMTGLTIPFILLAPSVVVDFYGPPYLSPGYSQSICFPSQFPANLIFFTGPVICSIGLNLVSLTRVIIDICRVRLEISSMIKKARSFRDATIYLRILVLSGIFWIIGIISVLTYSEWLNYSFSLLCGLHGFFIAVANLTTSRTRGDQKSFDFTRAA